MSQDKRPTKEEIEAMLGDYRPEVIEYDPNIDAAPTRNAHRAEGGKTDEACKTAQTPSKKLSKEEIEAILSGYQAETVEYDPEIDGGNEHKVRDEHLKEKEKLKDVITRLKEKNRGDRKVRR